VTGKLLSEIFPKRDDYVLATKVHFPTGKGPNDQGLSRKHIMASIDASLARLGTDHVDLYQIHRWDEETPIEETMEALHDVVKAGKARYIGASSMAAWQFSKAQYTARLNGWTRFVSMQPHFNLLYREEEREMLPLCLDQGVGVIPWSPLARGLLARAGAPGATARTESDARIEQLYGGEADQEILGRVAALAEARGVPAAQVALAWVIQQPGVTAPIMGATKERHVDDAVAAAELGLAGEELAELAEPYRARPVLL
jgi:aryl-alcohol dehydrogenase-like predicted oxidoreductase